jgi:UPF0755 protein
MLTMYLRHSTRGQRGGARPVFIAIIVVLALIEGVVWLMRSPYQGFANDVFLTVPHGAKTVDIGRELAQAGVIRYAWQFWAERAMHGSQKIQAGEYRFHDAASVGSVFDRLGRGDVYYFEFTVPEGSNMFDIARSLESEGVMPAADFLLAASNPEPIHDLAPNAPTLEGYLFPSTYRLSHSTTAGELCREMTSQFRKEWRRLIEKTAGQGHSAGVQATVTLASMVEKETSVPEERALVAGVFANRLEKGMKLDCDPTTIYAALLDNRFRKTIHKSDLASQNPYNTYQHAGLPPGPIANPGAAALEAALAPVKTDYLYFVAKADGTGHNFSSTLAGHERATQAYRKKSRKAA